MNLLISECKSCKSPHIEYRLFNKWSINRELLYGLTFGCGLTITGFLFYKIYKFKNSLNASINEINSLKNRIDNVLIEISHIKDNNLDQRVPLNASINQQFKALSIASLSESNLPFETPNTSPPQTDMESDDESTDFDMSEVDSFKDPIEDKKPLKSALKQSKFDDSIYELLGLSQDNLNDMINETKNIYLNDELNIEKILSFVKLLYVKAELNEDDNLKKKIFNECYELAKKALESNDKIYLTHKWYALTLGRIIDYMSLNEKVKNSIDFKKHLDIAIELYENDAYLFYMRGIWSYRMSNLTWTERQALKFFLKELPKVRIEDSIEDFKRVEQLFPKKLKGNLLYLAKYYISLKDIDSALEHIKVAIELPTRTKSEEKEHQELIGLREKYLK